MILIISNPDDYSTNEVIDWLLYFNQPFIRVTKEDKLNFFSVAIDSEIVDVGFSVSGKTFRVSDFKSVWYRRGVVEWEYEYFEEDEDQTLNSSINHHLKWEKNEIARLFFELIKPISINKLADLNTNKLHALYLAKEIGLSIPNTLITSKKVDVKDFLNQQHEIITKNFAPGVFIRKESHYILGYTEEITEDILNSLPEDFLPSMFQKKIDKEFEIRSFYLKGDFFSMAIFSQEDNMTKTDFRNYNFTKPNRTPPFKLPDLVSSRLNLLMERLGLNCGSIDLIYSKDKQFVFLEVNPIGLFTQVSQPCNYNLECKIAEALIK